ncbi:MAG: hypothetical protein ABH839_01730 [Chloroflexota bacterium]
MDFNFSLGLFIGFIIAGASLMIGVSQCIGIAILVLTAIWGFLFVNPMSPVKKYWWSASGKLAIMTQQTPGYEPRANSEYISVWVELTSWSGIMVDRIVIKIGQKRISSFDWNSHEVIAREHKFLDFGRPDWLCSGEYRVKLIAYTTEGYSKSRKFILKVNT